MLFKGRKLRKINGSRKRRGGEGEMEGGGEGVKK